MQPPGLSDEALRSILSLGARVRKLKAGKMLLAGRAHSIMPAQGVQRLRSPGLRTSRKCLGSGQHLTHSMTTVKGSHHTPRPVPHPRAGLKSVRFCLFVREPGTLSLAGGEVLVHPVAWHSWHLECSSPHCGYSVIPTSFSSIIFSLRTAWVSAGTEDPQECLAENYHYFDLAGKIIIVAT